jgi:hypothetical protein
LRLLGWTAPPAAIPAAFVLWRFGAGISRCFGAWLVTLRLLLALLRLLLLRLLG